MTERRYFSGNSIEQAVMSAARHYKVDPKNLSYKEMEKKHGFVKTRRGVVIEVDPSNPRKPLSDEEAYQRAMKMDPEAHLGRDPQDPSYVTDPSQPSRRRQRRPSRPRTGGSNQANAESSRPPRKEAKRDQREVQPRSNGDRASRDRGRQAQAGRDQSRPSHNGRDQGNTHRSRDVEGGARNQRDRAPQEPRTQESRTQEPRNQEPSTQESKVQQPQGRQAEMRPERQPEMPRRVITSTTSVARTKPEAQGPAAEAAHSGITSLLGLAGLDLQIKVHQGEDRLEVDLAGVDEKRVTQRGGEPLAALQQLMPSLIRSETGERVFCRVDCDGFHEIQEERLRDLAQRVAGKVGRGQRAQVLESMPPAERRIVHMTLADDPAVSTESLGNGYFKRIRVSPV